MVGLGRSTAHIPQPKTLLAFYAVVVGLTWSACVGTISVLAATGTAVSLIAWVLTAAAGVTLIIIVAVAIATIRGPEGLMLQEVNAQEYVDIMKYQTLRLGNSFSGESAERFTVIDGDELRPVRRPTSRSRSVVIEPEFTDAADESA
jgi:hypothetical protein